MSSLLSPAEWSALRLSLQIGLCAAFGGLPLAVAMGYLLARGRWRGKWFVEVIVNLPLVLPPVVSGYLLLLCLGPRGPVGRLFMDWFGVKLVFTWEAAAVASGVLAFPLMVRAMRIAFEAVDPRLELAARGLGASRWRAFWSVALPLARRGLVAGLVLGFARSVGEFGATIMVAGNIEGQTRTLPLAIFTVVNQPGPAEQAWRLVVLSILLAAAALAASEWLQRRRGDGLA